MEIFNMGLVFHSILFCLLFSGEIAKSYGAPNTSSSGELSKETLRNILKFLVALGNIDPENPQTANIGSGTKIGQDGRVEDLTAEQNASLEEAFNRVDKDGNGVIGKAEISAIFKAIHKNLADEKIVMMVGVVDTDGSGEIDLSEFKELMVKAISEEGIQRIFKVFDDDSSGSIQVIEFRNTMKKFGIMLTEQEINTAMNEGDTDGDGSIDLDEFKKMLA